MGNHASLDKLTSGADVLFHGLLRWAAISCRGVVHRCRRHSQNVHLRTCRFRFHMAEAVASGWPFPKFHKRWRTPHSIFRGESYNHTVVQVSTFAHEATDSTGVGSALLRPTVIVSRVGAGYRAARCVAAVEHRDRENLRAVRLLPEIPQLFESAAHPGLRAYTSTFPSGAPLGAEPEFRTLSAADSNYDRQPRGQR